MAERDDVFLSYSHRDGDAAALVRAALEKAELSVFWDKTSIRDGDGWLTRLQAAVEACGAFVVLVGRDGVERWVGAETEAALNRHYDAERGAKRLPLFPILLGDTDPEALPPFLRLVQARAWDGTSPLD